MCVSCGWFGVQIEKLDVETDDDDDDGKKKKKTVKWGRIKREVLASMLGWIISSVSKVGERNPQ